MASLSARPNWQRNSVFRFFASLKLAVVLLAVLIVAAITGTIYETSFDAKVARDYIYGAPWFNFWLVLLGANLAVSALSRWPWRKHHVAFLVTHLGIITLLTGSLIGRIWGTEGTITLFKGDPPTNRLLIDEHQLRVRDTDGIMKGYRAEFLHHPPTPQRPRDLGLLASGARLSIIDYASAIDGKLNPRALPEGGVPALHFTISTEMMNQHLESWLLADDPQNGSFSMGLANIEMKRGRAVAVPESREAKSKNPEELNPTVASRDSSRHGGQAVPLLGMTDLEESIFSFSKAPEEQIGRVGKGGSTGAKVRLEMKENEPRVIVSLGDHEASFAVAGNVETDRPMEGTPFTVRINNYWPDFRMVDGKPGSISDQPNNPAVLVTIRGKGVPMSANAPNPHGKDLPTTGGPPTMPGPGGQVLNHLTLFVADDGGLSYELISRKTGTTSGRIDINQPLTTGWADWKLKIDRIMPHAEQWMDFLPAKSDQITDLLDGVRVRVEQKGETFEHWVPAGWQITVPTSPNETGVAYGWKTVSLPIGLELLNFEVKRNEGNDSPAGFKSTLRASTADGESATGSCWMNNPFSFPGAWWRTWTGLTYKISQASWNPENLNQSTVQILRDPGWLFKWIGSLLIVAGVFMMFYLRPYRKQTAGRPILPPSLAEQKPGRTKTLITAN
jgi:hypothetical protein